MILPNLFIAGAQKSGTTSLHFLLKSHPQIFIPETPQEIHFFSVERNYQRGLDWYSSLFQDWQQQTMVAQTSPMYLYEPEVPERIAEVAPNSKFIFILRNPIDRAYSHYWHCVRYGYEDLSFETALLAENSRLSQNRQYRRLYSYCDRGRYVTQLKRFFAVFPPENILLLTFEQIQRNPQELYGLFGSFLEINPDLFASPDLLPKQFNKSRIPRLKALAKLVRREYQEYNIYHRQRPISLLARINRKFNWQTVDYPPMLDSTRVHLNKEFAEDILDLEQMTGWDLKSWLT